MKGKTHAHHGLLFRSEEETELEREDGQKMRNPGEQNMEAQADWPGARGLRGIGAGWPGRSGTGTNLFGASEAGGGW
jgi:hypothetical protein